MRQQHANDASVACLLAARCCDAHRETIVPHANPSRSEKGAAAVVFRQPAFIIAFVPCSIPLPPSFPRPKSNQALYITFVIRQIPEVKRSTSTKPVLNTNHLVRLSPLHLPALVQLETASPLAAGLPSCLASPSDSYDL